MANDPIFKPPKGAHDYRRQRLSHHLLSAAPTRHAHASTKMSAMYPNGSVSAVMHGFAPQLSPPRSSSLLQPPVFRAARTARWASSVALFVVAYMRRKPSPRRRHQPKKYLRADYCCKNQEPGCYDHLFILVFKREPGRCLLRPAAEARLSPKKRSRKSLVARTASAWSALLVQRGNLNRDQGSA